jgi:hypothetical protein
MGGRFAEAPIAMRASAIIGLILALATLARAQGQSPPAVLVSAAVSSAVDNLNADVSARAIRSDLTVNLFLDRTNAHPRLLAVLRRAQQIGGPRWIDPQTCQIRLDIPAATVRQELRQIAVDNAKTTPISADELTGDLKSWDALVFSATGTSTASIDQIRPPVGSITWQNASPDEVRRDITAARQDAANKILASIHAVPLARGKSVGDALAIPAVGREMNNWIITQPITNAAFQDNRQVQVTLAVSSAGLAEKLRSVLTGRTDLPLPADDHAWSDVTDAITRQMSAPTGQGGTPAAAVSAQAAQFALPDPPPDWIFRQLDAAATANADTPLHAARAAELAATDNLRQQIQQLPLAGHTLKEVAAARPRFAAAIDRTLARSAHVYSVDYEPDGSADVRISLDLQDLWQMLWLAQ